jgi:NAD(P)-dependent dehydrogenase (short-subunit alcohol dehydrogenase family)
MRANCISPGFIDTSDAIQLRISTFPSPPLEDYWPFKIDTDKMQLLKGRKGSGGDVARMAWWLCDGEESGFVTGQDLGLDGGMGKKKAGGI